MNETLFYVVPRIEPDNLHYMQACDAATRINQSGTDCPDALAGMAGAERAAFKLCVTSCEVQA